MAKLLKTVATATVFLFAPPDVQDKTRRMSAPANPHLSQLGPALVAEWHGEALTRAAGEVLPQAPVDGTGRRGLAFHLHPNPAGGGLLRLDGAPLCSAASDAHLGPLIEKTASVLAVRLAPDWLVLHAGLMGRGDRFLLLPAERRSGKSTLCLVLASQGWTYAGDDLVFFHPIRRVFHPFLKAITVKEGSFGLLSEPGPVHQDPARGRLRYATPALQAREEIPAGQLSAVLLPLYDPAAPAEGEHRPLAPEVAALALVQQLVGGAGRGAGSLEWIRELCALPAHLIRYPSAETSVLLAAACLEGRR